MDASSELSKPFFLSHFLFLADKHIWSLTQTSLTFTWRDLSTHTPHDLGFLPLQT